jgi:hypothetical protein
VVSMDRTGPGHVFRHRSHSASAGVLKAAARLRHVLADVVSEIGFAVIRSRTHKSPSLVRFRANRTLSDIAK